LEKGRSPIREDVAAMTKYICDTKSFFRFITVLVHYEKSGVPNLDRRLIQRTMKNLMIMSLLNICSWFFISASGSAFYWKRIP